MRKFMETTEQVTETETDHTESLKTLDKQAIEDPDLISKVEDKLSRLRNLNELTKDDDLNRLGEKETAVSDKDSEDSTPDVTDDSDAQDGEQAVSKDDTDDSTPKTEKKDDIPDAYIRAAIHQGWSQEVVDDFIKSDPELAKKAFENCYLSVNNASREWAELGRAKIDQDRKQVQAPVKEIEQEDPNTTALVAKLRKEYADDPLIEVVIKGLEDKPKPQPVQQQPVSQPQQNYETATARANAAANSAIDQKINNFFSVDNMKPYNQFYGKLELGQMPEDLSNGQQHNRLAVLQEAECIMAGYGIRGQHIEVEQALEKAHFVVTEPIRKQIIRDGLKATATKREKSMTLKPSESKRSSDSMTESSKPRNRRELERSVQQNLDSVFKK